MTQKDMKKFIAIVLGCLLLPTTSHAQRLQQKLGRAVVVTNRTGGRSVTSTAGTGALVSWRKLAQEPEGTTYNLYRRTAGSQNYIKVNKEPLPTTNYKLTSVNSNTEYAVTAISPDGVESEKSTPFLYKTQPWQNVWFKFDFDDKVIRRDDYRTKFVWPMDLDGDGEVDAMVCDRLYASAVSDDADNTENSATTTHKIQAYRLTGELLWTVDMGPNVNICGGQNDMVVAWDINCDGRCEVIIKSSDGTRFWDKQHNTWGKYAMGSDVADVDGDGIVDYRTQTVRNRPFYVSVIDGETGAEIACSELNYDEVTDGTDAYTRNNRASYMSDGYAAMDGHFCICYLDGIHPSLVMECLDREPNKTHHNYVFSWDYDWTGGQPANWHHSATWSRNDKRPWPAEFHQLRVADVDGDGRDEMVQGGYSVNPLTGWFLSPGIGHGDRHVMSDIDPDRPGMEVFAIQQSDLLGQLVYDARTGERIKEWYLPSLYDVGRGTCMDVDPAHKGYELYSHADDYIYDCKGEKTAYTRSGCGIKQIFEGVWWNGDLLREELSSPGGSGWGTNLMVTQVLNKARLIEFSQESDWATHAANGTRPAFMGDITGDWREEVILASQNDNGSTGLVGYTTHIPTDYSIYCLQQDPHYRGDCTTRGYYQHPNTSFYLGVGMPLPPLPPVFEADLRWQGGTTTVESGFSTFDMNAPAPYTDGRSIMFDLSGDNASPIRLTSPLKPSVLYLMTPLGHDYTFRGTATAGSGQLIKSMLGTVTVNGDLGHTGTTIISEGTLAVNGTVSGPVELRAKGTLAGNITLQDTVVFEGALNYEGCRLMPGGEDIPSGVMLSKKSMTLPGDVYMEVKTDCLHPECMDCPPLFTNGRLVVEGDLTFRNTNYITVNLATPDAADYVIAECTGTLTCDPSQLKTRGLEGINYDLVVVDNQKLVLKIHATRAPQNDVVWTGDQSGLWDYKTPNFALGSFAAETQTTFVAGDAVIFNEHPLQKTVTLNDMMVVSGVTFDTGKYTLTGEGGISGTGGITVNRHADVTLNMKYSDYTGATIVNGGKLTVPNFYDGGQKSALGAATADKGNLTLNGGTLVLSRDNMSTNRQLTVTDTATISIQQASSSLSLKGMVSGTGYLVKDGSGQLNFTYAGTNNFAGLIVRKGIVAQGAWNSTFGRSGSPMLLAGGEVHQIDVNSTTAVPTFNHAVTVQEGTVNRIVGSSRGRINGSFSGKGALTIETRYVRCDVGADFSQFEGTLTAKGNGGNFRLMSNVTDLSKAHLVIGAGTTVAHFAGGSNNTATVTTKIGALEGTAADGVLGGSASSYEVGALGENTTFSGLLQAARITKTGSGVLTLRSAGHTSPITVSGGTLELSNTASTAMTSGTITVGNGATLRGNGMAQTVIVNKGGTITGGIATMTGKLRLGGNLTLAGGSTLLCRLTASSNSQLVVSGKVTHQGDTILIDIPASRTLHVGDVISVLSAGSQTGDFVLKVVSETADYEFDTSSLLTDGTLRVTGTATGLRGIASPNQPVDVYAPDGTKLRTDVVWQEALRGLPTGIYIVNGKKITLTK